MPSVLHMGLVGNCSHSGLLTVIDAGPRVRAGGLRVLTQHDPVVIAGCTLPKPCVKVRWMAASTKIFAGGRPVVLASSPGTGVAADEAPQGPVIIIGSQVKVQGAG